MNAPGERGSASVLSVALYNRLSVSQGLAVTAGNAVGRSRSLCRTIHDRRRQPDFFRHLAKYV